MTSRFIDNAPLRDGTRQTEDGYLIAEAFAVRTGIQLYRGSEVNKADMDVVRVYRPEDEVRAADSLATFSHAPITLGHPDRVTADNWKDLAKGEVSTEAVWEGNKIKLPLIVKDAEAIQAIQGGMRELSAGYTCVLDWTAGETPEGEAYDAIQRDIRVNHLAIVPRGRAGSECRIGDDAEAWGAAPIQTSDKKEGPMPDALTSVVLGDKAVQVTPDAAVLLEQFKADQSQKHADEMAKLTATHDAAVAAKDKELADKDTKIADLEGKVLSDADLDKRVATRAALVADAAKVDSSVKTEGLSDAAIRKAVVEAKLGKDVIADKTEAYIEARFDGLLDAVGDGASDPLRNVLGDMKPPKASGGLSKAYDERNTALQDAWKGDK